MDGNGDGRSTPPNILELPDAALAVIRPAVLTLFHNWLDRRQTAVAVFVAEYQAEHGAAPTADQVAAGLTPPLSEPAAAWLLQRLPTDGDASHES